MLCVQNNDEDKELEFQMNEHNVVNYVKSQS